MAEVHCGPLAAVAEIVSVAVTPLVPVMLIGLVEPKLRVGGYWASAGLEVMTAVNTTLPAKPPFGATVIVEVFPVVAPGVTVTGVPLTLKPGIVIVRTAEAVELCE
jgi:hypothetical protein